MDSLENKVALITGGGVRVGKVFALALAKAGADIVLSYVNFSEEETRKTKAEIEALGRKCLIVEADMRNIPQLQELIKKTDETFGRLDILIHNAANFNEGLIDTVTEEVWNSSFDIILKGAFFLSQAAIPLMMKHKSGRIISMIGDSYYENWPTCIPHSIAKIGLVKLMECLTVALTPYIQCFAVCPATIMESAKGGYSMELMEKGFDASAMEKNIVNIHGHDVVRGNPEQVSELIMFLCTCSNYMNGAVIPIDGGKHLM